MIQQEENMAKMSVAGNLMDHRKMMYSMYEILQSLQDACCKAGRKAWTTEELEKTTVKELLFQLATNNVRFIHVPDGCKQAIVHPSQPMPPFVDEE